MKAFSYKFVSPNQSDGKQAIFKISSNSKQPSNLNKPSEVEKENEKSFHNEVNEQIKLKEHFSELFTRQGQLIGPEIKIEFKPHVKITQQKGRRVPIQLQNAVQKEIDLRSGNCKQSRREREIERERERSLQSQVTEFKRTKQNNIDKQN